MTKKEHIIPIIKIIVFIIGTILLFFTVNLLTTPIRFGDGRRIYGFYGERKNSLDMVYIGGSACFVYYQPLKSYEEYGFASYNFSVNTIQPEFYKYMVQEALKNQKPELIIIDVRAFQYRDKDQPPSEINYRNVLTSIPLSKNKVNFVEKYVKEVLNDDDTIEYYVNFIKYHNEKDEAKYSLKDGLKMTLRKYKEDSKGSLLVPLQEKQNFINYETDEVRPMEEDTVKILDDLLKYLKKEDLNVLFVVSNYIEEEDHKKVFNYIENKVKKAGFDFIDANDYREEMGVDYNTDFYDFRHFNPYGSEKYTDFINKYITEHYNLKDHRNDPNYNDWNESLKTWKENKELVLKAMREDLISNE